LTIRQAFNSTKTMTIKVTQSELYILLSKALGMNVTGVVISKGHVKVVQAFLDRMTKEVGLSATENGFPPDQKIPAIKALRTVTAGMNEAVGSYGLAEAKWIVENWPRFIKEYSRLGRLPRLGGTIFSTEGPTFS
jgi:ribosomal protein L7/L12